MTPDAHGRLSEVFLGVRELPPDRQRVELDRLAAEDPGLAEQVRRLLRADAPAGEAAIDRPIFEPFWRAGPGSAGAMLGECRAGDAVYRPLRIIGEGGSSTVYLGEQAAPIRRRVALKVLRHTGGGREPMARFEAERQAIAMMSHPGIAALYDSGITDDGRLFFAMELVEGEPITAYVRRCALTLRETLALFLSLCEAVVHAHQKGVLHRDLKPTNILVASDPAGPRVKVIDFGLAKSLGPVRLHERTFATAHGQLVGTLAYMSPEQLAGDPRHIDVRADVYALGAVLQEMLTGAPAMDLEGVDLPEALRRVEAGRRAPLRAGGRALPADLGLIIAKAMAPEPAHRYAGVPGLAADVGRFLDSRPVLARGPGAAYVARKFAARHKAATAALAVVAVSLTAAGVWAAASQRRAERYYRTSRDTAEFLLSDVVIPLSDQIGSRSVRRAVLSRLLEQTGEFALQEAEDADVQAARAVILGALADLEEQEGRLESASAYNEAALELRRALADRFPDEPARRADLSIALVRAGDMRLAREGWDAALPFYHEALAIDEDLAARFPGNATFRSNLAWSYDRLGVGLMIAGDDEGARRYFEAQRRTMSDPLARRPGRSDAERCLLAAEMHLSGLALRAGDAAAAIDHAREAHRWGRRAMEAEPRGRVAALAHSGACILLAERLTQAGQYEEARERVAEASALAQSLVLADVRDRAALGMLRSAAARARELGEAAGMLSELRAWVEGAERLIAEAEAVRHAGR